MCGRYIIRSFLGSCIINCLLDSGFKNSVSCNSIGKQTARASDLEQALWLYSTDTQGEKKNHHSLNTFALTVPRTIKQFKSDRPAEGHLVQLCAHTDLPAFRKEGKLRCSCGQTPDPLQPQCCVSPTRSSWCWDPGECTAYLSLPWGSAPWPCLGCGRCPPNISLS